VPHADVLYYSHFVGTTARGVHTKFVHAY